MKKLLAPALSLVLGTCAIAPAMAQTSLGVSIGINQPGVYGQINIGNFPQPRLVSPQPVIITQRGPQMQPIYLYVPPGHQKNWRKHCSRYNACGQPVYFVREDWVRERYDQEHRGDNRGEHDRGHGNKRHDKRD
jgi:hypothetical protein